jgi:hypothetical protein
MPRPPGSLLLLLILPAFLLLAFARLAAQPSALVTDADQPSLDFARRGKLTPGNDLTRLFLPLHASIADRVAHFRHFPLWDDRGFGGRPLVGNPQASLFYPPVWLAWWSRAPAALGWITVAHLLWAGLGAYVLARTLKISVWGALTSAICFELSPYVLAQTYEGHYPHVWAAAWYPWAFASWVRLVGGDLRGGPGLAVAMACCFLTGHPQEVYYLAIALGLATLVWGIGEILARRVRPAAIRGLMVLGGFGLVVGLSAVEWLPDALAQRFVIRSSAHTIAQASRYHLDPSSVLQLLAPDALGGPRDYFGHDNYWESVTSIGLIPLFLAGVGCLASVPRQRGWAWLALVAGAILFASGRKLGLFAAAYHLVPGMDRFRAPARALFLASLAGSVLAGLGIDALRRLSRDQEGWNRMMRWSLPLACLMGLIVLGGSAVAGSRLAKVSAAHSGGRERPGRLTEADRFARGLSRLAADPRFWLALAAPSTILVLGRFRPARRQALVTTLGLLGGLELACDGFDLLHVAPAGRFLDPGPIGEALVKARGEAGPPPRIRAVDWLFDDLKAGQAGFGKTNLDDSFQLEHAAALYEPLYHLLRADPFDLDRPMDGPAADFRRQVRQAILDRMAVEFVVNDDPSTSPDWPLIAEGRVDGSSWEVRRNPTALPRAYLVPTATIVGVNHASVNLFARSNPRASVLMSSNPVMTLPGPRQRFTPVAWLSSDPDHLVLEVETRAPGLLVIADTAMPGWSAEVDGRFEQVLTGNLAQRVLPIRNLGRQRITLDYDPPGLAIGLAITAGSLAVCLGWLIFSWRVVASDGPEVIEGKGRVEPSSTK